MSAAITIGEWMEGVAPAWLVSRSVEARRELRVVGAALDAAMASLLAARDSWWVTKSPDALLELHGRIRGLPRYSGEAAAVYRARLAIARQLYRESGRRSAVLKVLAALGFPNADVVELYLEGTPRHDGTYSHNGELRHNGGARRFKYDVRLSLADGALSLALLDQLRAECRRWAPGWAVLAAVVVDAGVSADAAPHPADEPMTVTVRHYHLHDGSVLHDGSINHEPFSTSTLEAP